jgi:phage terminase small subunit
MKRKLELTGKQAQFVAEYLIDLNASDAALRAGYSKKTAWSTGHHLMHKPHVTAAIREALARRTARVEIKSDDVLRELMRVLGSDLSMAFNADGTIKPIHEIPEDTRRAIASIETDELFSGTGKDRVQVGVTRKIKFWSKDKAIENAMRHLGMLRDRVSVENPDGTPLVDGPALVQMARAIAAGGRA